MMVGTKFPDSSRTTGPSRAKPSGALGLVGGAVIVVVEWMELLHSSSKLLRVFRLSLVRSVSLSLGMFCCLSRRKASGSTNREPLA